MRHTGRVLIAAALGQEHGFTDVDGATPCALTLNEQTVFLKKIIPSRKATKQYLGEDSDDEA
jgi:hypothetical protein